MTGRKQLVLIMVSILLFSFGSCAKPKENKNGVEKTQGTETQGTETPDKAAVKTGEELIPEFFVEAVQPLLYAVGSVIGWGYVDEFDASRGAEVDRTFADALLYEFLNSRNYDQNIEVTLDENVYMHIIKAKDMMYLLRQYIGDYPRLIDPPAGLFIFLNDDGDYIYAGSDKGFTDYKITVENVNYLGSGIYELKTSLYKLDYDEDSEEPEAFVNNYSLQLQKADNTAYGYTIIKCGLL